MSTPKQQPFFLWIIWGIIVFGFASYWYKEIYIPKRNMERYRDIVREAAARHQLPESLVLALIWKESRFNYRARGKAGEIGLMQLMPISVKEWQQRTKASCIPSDSQLFDPVLNIEIGCWYLAWCGRHWNGYKSRTLLQLSEYNAGYRNVVKRWKPQAPDVEVKLEDITIKSTRIYVREIMEKSRIYQQLLSKEEVKAPQNNP